MLNYRWLYVALSSALTLTAACSGGSGHSGDCSPACSETENCLSGQCVAPASDTCRGVMHCVDGCTSGDYDCGTACVQAGDQDAQDLFMALVQCMDTACQCVNNDCTPCEATWEQQCAQQKQDCLTDGRSSTNNANNTNNTNSINNTNNTNPPAVVAFMAGDWVCPQQNGGESYWSFFPNQLFIHGFAFSTEYPGLEFDSEGYAQTVDTVFSAAASGEMGAFTVTGSQLNLTYAEDGMSETLSVATPEGFNTPSTDDDLLQIGSLQCIRSTPPHTARPALPQSQSYAAITVNHGSSSFNLPILDLGFCEWDGSLDHIKVIFKTYGGHSVEFWLWPASTVEITRPVEPFLFSAFLRVGLYQDSVQGTVTVTNMVRGQDPYWLMSGTLDMSAAGDAEVARITVTGSFTNIPLYGCCL